jgi:ribonuclease P protein component
MRRETHLSAEQARSQAPAWFPPSHGDEKGPSGYCPPQGAWPQKAVGLTSEAKDRGKRAPQLRLDRMKTRADFLRAQKGRRVNLAALGLEMCPTPEALSKAATLRVGFTASTKVGNAVARNRAKRRLRAAARALLPLLGSPGHDYVLIARTLTVTRPFAELLDDLTKAMGAIERADASRKKEKRNG